MEKSDSLSGLDDDIKKLTTESKNEFDYEFEKDKAQSKKISSLIDIEKSNGVYSDVFTNSSDKKKFDFLSSDSKSSSTHTSYQDLPSNFLSEKEKTTSKNSDTFFSVDANRTIENEKKPSIEIPKLKLNIDDNKTKYNSDSFTNSKCYDFLNWDNGFTKSKEFTKESDLSDNLNFEIKREINRSKYYTLDSYLNSDIQKLSNIKERFRTQGDLYSKPIDPIIRNYSAEMEQKSNFNIDTYRLFPNASDKALNLDLKKNFSKSSMIDYETDKKSYQSNINSLDDLKYLKNPPSYTLHSVDRNYQDVNNFKRDTAISAFETDSDVLLLQKTGQDIKGISPITQKYLSFNNLTVPDKKSEEMDLKYNTETKFENEFLNIFSLKIKKNGSEINDQLSTHQYNNNNNNNNYNELNEDSRNDTMESEHLDSDYTKCPVFPSEVYGSRPRVDPTNKEGIYTRKSTVAPKKPERVHFREDNKMLDPKSLKMMDKKLKKLIKKNLKEDLKSHIQSEEFKQNPGSISWDIPVEDNKRADEKIDETASTITQIPDPPYLPLRDVPVHELVKKLRYEFELQGDISCIPNGLDDIYHKFQNEYKCDKTREDSDNNLDDSIQKDPKGKFENFVREPARVFIESIKKDSNNPEEEQENISVSKLEKLELNIQEDEPKKIEMNSIDQEIKENLIKKSKIQELILNQKKKHEKRIKTLEKLVKFEKLQAEKLKKIMLLNQNDSMCSLIYDSFLQKNNFFLDQSKIDEEYLEKLEQEKNLIDENLKRLNEFYKKDKKKSSEPKRIPLSELNCSKIDLQSSESETLSAPENNESGIDSSETSSLKNKIQENHAMPPASWFFPIQPTKNQIKPFEPKLKIKPSVTENIPSNKLVLTNQTKEADDKKLQLVEIDDNPFLKKNELQDAFQMNMYNFLKRSRNRVKEIKLKAARRQVAAELKVQDYHAMELKVTKPKPTKQEKDPKLVNSNKKFSYFTIDKGLFSKNRVMTSQEIIEQTKKKYQKLPEVQQKQLKQKMEENKIRNRIKSNIFKKTIQQKVLSSGPNFNLNFKAIKNPL